MADTKNIIGLGMDPPSLCPCQVSRLTLNSGSSASRMRQCSGDNHGILLPAPRKPTPRGRATTCRNFSAVDFCICPGRCPPPCRAALRLSAGLSDGTSSLAFWRQWDRSYRRGTHRLCQSRSGQGYLLERKILQMITVEPAREGREFFSDKQNRSLRPKHPTAAITPCADIAVAQSRI
jgi:hypothetical protein